ncbi:hypothetical protein, partial [Tepidimonas sp.]|uniref:hypothetical protein n=1 Tax=Tepidimonas sp. TaxID=2002775 RepID=UPI003919DD34
MPTLPIITSQSNANSLASRGTPGVPRINPRAFDTGAGDTAAAIQGVGNKLMKIATEKADQETRLRNNERIAEFMAQNDPTPLLLDIQANEPLEAIGQRTQERLTQWIDQTTGSIEDPAMRSSIRTAYLSKVPQYTAQATQFGAARSADTVYANALAKADPTPLLLSVESEVPANGAGLYETSRNKLSE